MKEILFPYGKEKLNHKFDSKELAGVLTSSIEEYEPEMWKKHIKKEQTFCQHNAE